MLSFYAIFAYFKSDSILSRILSGGTLKNKRKKKSAFSHSHVLENMRIIKQEKGKDREKESGSSRSCGTSRHSFGLRTFEQETVTRPTA
ncbi:MAG: hypothetical protein HYY60_03225 [Parcubacteria group bacterium]|nr:hypothetical protein [Parcubacteria group bacterium]MBI3074923.1 hypothetical protein [Parcubacteria group bacterium]